MSSYGDGVVSVEFAVFLPYNETYIDSEMWIGAAVELNNDRIWTAEIKVTVANTTFSDMVSEYTHASADSLFAVTISK